MKKSERCVILAALLGLILCGCSASGPASAPSPVGQDGILALSRPMPEPIAVAAVLESTFPTGTGPTGTGPAAGVPLANNMLGFVPTSLSPASIAPAGTWLSINRREKTVSLMEGSKVSITVHGDGIEQLSAGSFHLLHKQRSPLWYAPDTYFTERGLAVPPEGDRERYRRGALGEFAMFLDKDTPLHAGIVWTDDVGGVRVDENDLARLYYSLDVGSTIKVE